MFATTQEKDSISEQDIVLSKGLNHSKDAALFNPCCNDHGVICHEAKF